MFQLPDPQYKTADGSALRIWRDTAPNRFLTEKLGRPLFDECIYVEVISPGSRDSTPVFEVERIFDAEMEHPDPLRGPKYAEYKTFIDDFLKGETGDASLAGTPLEQWSEMTRAMVATLKAQGIFTVDALANLPDTRLIVVGPDGRAWRTKAAAYIEASKGGAYATELAARLERSEADKVDLQRQVSELAASVAALQAAGKTGKTAGKAPPEGDAAKPAVVDPLGAPDPLAGAPVAQAAEGETLVPAKAPEQPII